MQPANHPLSIWSQAIIKERGKDLILSCLIACIGIIGSYLVLGKSISSKQHAAQEDKLGRQQISNKLEPTESHKNNTILIQGSLIAGSIIKITHLYFDENQQYLLDYGNGIRHKMTASTVHMRYNTPGLYLLQCFVLKDNKWKLIGSQTVVIKQSAGKYISVL